MTIDEYKAALKTLTPEQMERLRQTWGGAKGTIEEMVLTFAHAEDPTRWERIIIARLGELGLTGLKTEDEKMVEAARASADAASVSAGASESSAKAAADSVRWARIAAVIAFGSLIVSVLLARC